MGYQSAFQLGSLVLPNNLFAAPLAGFTDRPFRRLCRHFFKGLIFCEMVKIEALVRRIPATLRYLEAGLEEHPLGAQICGSKPEIARQAALIIEEMGFDLIDLNCGCPVDKVIKDGSGSGLLLKPDLIGEMLSALVSSVKIPVTLKVRLGWDDDKINVLEVLKIAEKAGAKAITVHGRTRRQGYRGKASLQMIKECKQTARTIKVIGNGDLFSLEAVLEMFQQTGCDGVMLSRGMVGNPWLFEQIAAFPLKTEKSPEALKKTIQKHFELIQKEAGKEEKTKLFDMRRMIGWYLKGCSNAKELKMEVMRAEKSEAVFGLIENYPWDKVFSNRRAGHEDRDQIAF
ncbi:MAG: tRNA dihydrouridine synthase DusB [Parachlamydiales bacterium]|jgi:nifR3 family TIM-barrel protein